MRLRDYVKQHKIDIKAFAERLGYSRPYISNVVYDQVSASPRLAKKIEEETGGRVSRLSLLYPEEFDPSCEFIILPIYMKH